MPIVGASHRSNEIELGRSISCHTPAPKITLAGMLVTKPRNCDQSHISSDEQSLGFSIISKEALSD